MTTEPTTNLAPADERTELIEQMQNDPDRERMSFAEWFLHGENNDVAAIERVKAQADKLIAYFEARRRARQWRYGTEFRATVENDLAEQRKKDKRKKSVTYATGTAGFRKAPALVIVKDKKALMDWCGVNLPAAVPMEPHLHLTPIKEHFAKTGEIPDGCDVVEEREQFYPAFKLKELPNGAPERANGPSEEPD